MSTESTSKQINTILEPLVDSLSALVLETITGSLANIGQISAALGKATNDLLMITQRVALTANDEDLTNEVINAVNIIGDNIEKLVSSFAQTVKNRADPAAARAFSDAAQLVGDSINNLVLTADETSSKRLLATVRKCITKNKLMEKAAHAGQRGEVYSISTSLSETHQQLIDATFQAAAGSQIPNRKALLQDGINGLRTNNQLLINLAKELADSPYHTELQAKYTDCANEIGAAYRCIVEAAKIEEVNEFDRLKAALAKVAQLIDLAKRVTKNSGDLLNSFLNGGNYQGMLDEVEQEVDELGNVARSLLDDIHDPIMKRVVEKAIKDVKEAGKALIDAIKKGDKKAAQIAHHNLVNAAQRLVVASRSNAAQQYAIHMGTEALKAAVQDLEAALAAGDPVAVRAAAGDMATFARSIADELDRRADLAEDPKEKERLRNAADAIRKAAMALLAAAKGYDPNDPDARAGLLKAKGDLERAVAQARSLESTPEGFDDVDIGYRLEQEEEERRRAETKSAKPFSIFDYEVQQGDDPLLKASKEQALAALEVIREAEKYLNDKTDPKLRKEIMEASNLVKDLIGKVVDLARLCAENPNDPNLAKALADAQIDLAKAIAHLAGLTVKGDKDLQAALAALAEAAGDQSGEDPSGINALDLNEFYKLCALINTRLWDNWGEGKNTDVKAAVTISKEIAALVTKAGKLLGGMAKTVKAKDAAQKFDTNSKIISDNALKMKILAAVKAASGEDTGRQVGSAAMGLKTQVTDCVNTVKATVLRHRVKQTEKQISALKLIAAAVRKARFG